MAMSGQSGHSESSTGRMHRGAVWGAGEVKRAEPGWGFSRCLGLTESGMPSPKSRGAPVDTDAMCEL